MEQADVGERRYYGAGVDQEGRQIARALHQPRHVEGHSADKAGSADPLEVADRQPADPLREQ